MTRMQAGEKIYLQCVASGMAMGLRLAQGMEAQRLRTLDAEGFAVSITTDAWRNTPGEERAKMLAWIARHARVLLGLSDGVELAAEDAADFLNAACAAVNAQKRAAPAGAQPKTEHEGNHAHDKN